ncbi:hypothetical protein BAUCODRAFT_452678 [Baudoinia panamericana UAMH 10762]|uniref:LsmAD domain-containing protein n=1 Tax=Baudoinia panamericana (strain UAMH 10762) TaxID=717646 RepID=M2LSJ3_BAUPA|nr:uncharacterized protein BAUCODRAFT_452678 [Baudoinia panamericana UAMH 10762]EMC97447.1 hypothetical protein BAUCODRAFT_452678 [Baudoinia panamericana UAMH 10762]
MPNGSAEKPLPPVPAPTQGQQSAQPQIKSKMESHADKHAHDRLLFVLAHSQGMDATITLKNGEQFAGIFAGGSFDSVSTSKYALKMTRRVAPPSGHQVNGNVETHDETVGEGEDRVMTFDIQDTVSLDVKDVVTASAQQQPNGSISSSFRTDTEISGREPSIPHHRELQRWEPTGDLNIDMSLEDSGDSGWDQFATNERMYGVSSTYDENMYTTAIDRSNPQYQQRAAAAERIAREIEGSAAANPHVAEERKRDAEKGDGLDEEDKYSGVRREPGGSLPKRAAGAYVPPSQRPITGIPTVPGAPFDPAIISTAKPVPPPSAPPAQTSTPADSAKPAPQTQLAAPPTQLPTVESASKDAPPTSRDASRPRAAAAAQGVPAEKGTHDAFRQTADAFKDFANSEKLKFRQVVEQKRANNRHEKNVKLNDLKKFAENFKLKSRVPDDLVPILAKDREKQVEIQKKAEEEAKKAEVEREEKKKKDVIAATPPAPSTVTMPQAAAPPGPASEKRIPYNHSRTRQSQQMHNGPMVPMPGPIPGQSPARAMPTNQRQPSNQAFLRQQQPPLQDIHIPSGLAAEKVPLSPVSATSSSRFNIKAAEFRPTAANFTPAGTTPSPQRKPSTAESTAPQEPATASFFAKDSKPIPEDQQKGIDDAFNPVARMLAENKDTETNTNQILAKNGGIPFSYRTPPTWPGDENRSYKDSFPVKNLAPHPHSQGTSPMHTPVPNGHGPMPPHHHAHQLPAHMQGPPQHAHGPRPQYYGHGQHSSPGGGGGGFVDPRMHQQFGPPNGSVQSSPRFGPAQMAAFGPPPPGPNVGPPHGHHPMHINMNMGMGMGVNMGMNMGVPPQFAAPPYGMSPSMGARTMSGGLPPPGGPQGQQQQMQHFRGNNGGPQQQQQQFPGAAGGPPMMNMGMGVQMMVPNLSSQGGGFGGYPNSPMPAHASPYAHAASPRPGQGVGAGMMQHQGSHQGFNPQQQQQGQQQGAMYGAGPAGFGPGPHPMHQWQRQMSNSGSGMQGGGGPGFTPRQQHALPNSGPMGMAMPMPGLAPQRSPGMGPGGAGGEEGAKGG